MATKRGPALLLAARRRVRRAAALTRLAPAPKVGGILLPPPLRGLLAAPVRLRRPYNKEIYSPRASTLSVYWFRSPYYIFLFGILQYGIILLRAGYGAIIMRKSIYSKQYRMLTVRLKQARLDSGLSQAQVAKALGTTQSHISKAESGQRRLDVIQLKEFSKLYRKDFNYFIP